MVFLTQRSRRLMTCVSSARLVSAPTTDTSTSRITAARFDGPAIKIYPQAILYPLNSWETDLYDVSIRTQPHCIRR
jgi:hypothetical protein